MSRLCWCAMRLTTTERCISSRQMTDNIFKIETAAVVHVVWFFFDCLCCWTALVRVRLFAVLCFPFASFVSRAPSCHMGDGPMFPQSGCRLCDGIVRSQNSGLWLLVDKRQRDQVKDVRHNLLIVLSPKFRVWWPRWGHSDPRIRQRRRRFKQLYREPMQFQHQHSEFSGLRMQ